MRANDGVFNSQSSFFFKVYYFILKKGQSSRSKQSTSRVSDTLILVLNIVWNTFLFYFQTRDRDHSKKKNKEIEITVEICFCLILFLLCRSHGFHYQDQVRWFLQVTLSCISSLMSHFRWYICVKSMNIYKIKSIYIFGHYVCCINYACFLDYG